MNIDRPVKSLGKPGEGINDFHGKCVLITGGTMGIGLATGLAFARQGACPVLTYKWGTADEVGLRVEGVRAVAIATNRECEEQSGGGDAGAGRIREGLLHEAYRLSQSAQ